MRHTLWRMAAALLPAMAAPAAAQEADYAAREAASPALQAFAGGSGDLLLFIPYLLIWLLTLPLQLVGIHVL